MKTFTSFTLDAFEGLRAGMPDHFALCDVLRQSSSASDQVAEQAATIEATLKTHRSETAGVLEMHDHLAGGLLRLVATIDSVHGRDKRSSI